MVFSTYFTTAIRQFFSKTKVVSKAYKSGWKKYTSSHRCWNVPVEYRIGQNWNIYVVPVLPNSRIFIWSTHTAVLS